MICKKCGTEALDTDKFCNICGCRLKEDFNNYQQNIDEFKKADNFNSLIKNRSIITNKISYIAVPPFLLTCANKQFRNSAN